jgi:hypothetical protein
LIFFDFIPSLHVISVSKNCGQNYPRNVPLGDDTLLEAATLRGGSGDRDSEPIEFAPLARVDQAILLARCAEQKTRSPVLDELARVV